MIEQRGGGFVVPVEDARRQSSRAFGRGAGFEMQRSYPDVGVHRVVPGPSRPDCRRRRESAARPLD